MPEIDGIEACRRIKKCENLKDIPIIMEVVSASRGGVNISHADNGALIHDNPAVLINMPSGKLLDLNVEFIYPEVRYEDPVDFNYTKHEVFIILSFSFVYKNTEESRFTFGIDAFSPDKPQYRGRRHTGKFWQLNLPV